MCKKAFNIRRRLLGNDEVFIFIIRVQKGSYNIVEILLSGEKPDRHLKFSFYPDSTYTVKRVFKSDF